MKAYIYLVSSLMTLLLLLVSCSNDEVELLGSRSEISDIHLSVLDNRGMFPVSVNDGRVSKESFILALDFGKYKTESINGLPQGSDVILSDKIVSIKIIDKGESETKDISSQFKVHGSQAEDLTGFELNVFPPKQIWLLAVSLLESGYHSFELIVKFESGREIRKTTNVELL